MKATKRMAFTLIELLVVISIIALLIGILLPALGAARRTARQMQSNTQLRGIQQSMVMFAQGNSDHFPGLDSNGQLPKTTTDTSKAANGNSSGSTAFAFGTMLDNNYFTGEYIISPSETKQAWTTQQLTTKNFSYASLQITDAVPGTLPGSPTGTNQGRDNEWSQTLNTEAIVLSDRAKGTSGNFYSVNTSKDSHTWRGGVAWNDNHVEFESTSNLPTRYSTGPSITDDGLFADETGTVGTLNEEGYNAVMVYGHGSDVATIFSGDN